MFYVSVLRPVNDSANDVTMFRCIAKTVLLFEGDNIRPVIESADDVITFGCIVVLCVRDNKNDKKGLFWWRQCKNNILNLACIVYISYFI